ncbi:MAG TPA: arylsulfatase [Myxococcaceae bacterium]
MNQRTMFPRWLVLAVALSGLPAAAQKKPNILVIFGDDVGLTDVSIYSHGVMGIQTPNIDRIAKEGLMFTDYYAEQSCTAGRSSFITGQTVLRTGLSKVGLPGAKIGLQKEDITIAEALKPLGYATGQFGKNHLGDRNEFLPTAHGFDEFFGNLYHLNAEEEPENPDYPKDPEFRKKYGPRGVIHSWADGRVEDTGPLTIKRMETIDDETTAAAIGFIQKQVQAGKPFFVWMNTTHMHAFTHVRPDMRGKSGISEYLDTMIQHDQDVGKLLKVVYDLKIGNDTIVIYTTDNGPHMNSWPDGAMTPFRSEKDTNWEGAFRVPAMIRWTGHIKPGQISNEIFSGLDWFPTLLAAAGDAGVKDRLLNGWKPKGGALTYKIHLDGYNQLPYLEGKDPKSARKEFFYFDDDGGLVAVRSGNMKFVFCEQRKPGTLAIWSEPFVCLRAPHMFNLRMDPYERAESTSNTYWDWSLRHAFYVVPVQDVVAQFLSTFKKYPPRQKPSSFSVDQIIDQFLKATTPTSK